MASYITIANTVWTTANNNTGVVGYTTGNTVFSTVQQYPYYMSSYMPPVLTIGQLCDIDLLTGEIHLKKMASMDEISELFWSIVSNDYKEYLEWKRKKANGEL